MRWKKLPPSASVEYWSSEMMLAPNSCIVDETVATIPGRSAPVTMSRPVLPDGGELAAFGVLAGDAAGVLAGAASDTMCSF